MMFVESSKETKIANHPLPPAKQTHGVLGDLRPFQQDPLTYLIKLSRTVGGVSRFRASLWDIYLIAHPNAIAEALISNHSLLSKNTFTNQILRSVAGDGLLTLDDPTWQARRQLLQPAFGRDHAQSFTHVITSVTATMLQQWESVVDAGRPIDASQEMSTLALRIVCRAFFGVALDEQNEQIRTALNTLSNVFAQRTRSRLAALWGVVGFPSFGQGRLRAAQAALDTIAMSVVTRLRSHDQEEQTPFYQVARAVNDRDEYCLSDSEFCAEVRTFLVAGHETTAKALTWSLYLLSQHPEIATKLTQEACNLFDNRVPAASDLPALQYAQQVTEEVLRLYPPAWTLSRRAEEELVIGGYRIPKGARIMFSPYVTHRLEEFWSEPERFEPERHSPEKKKERHPYALIPFGVGAHQCIGKRFAMQEIQLILSMIFQKYKLTLVPAPPIYPDPQNILTPSGAISLKIVKQSQ